MKYPVNLDKWIARFVSGELTEKERASLLEWRDLSDENEELFRKLISENNCSQEVGKLARWDRNEAWKQVQHKTGRRKMLRKFYRVGVAAVSVLTIGLGGFLLLKPGYRSADVAGMDTPFAGIRFSRSSGEVYCLDTLKKLTLDNIEIEGNDREMMVKAQTATVAEKPEMNMIEVPVGAEYSLILPDGTKVLLNAATTFHFPDHFSGQTAREVYLDGEAYFEVTSDSIHPFIVHTDRTFVKVLGTSFNVMAYAGGEVQQTTLVKGKVCMGENQTGKEVELLPGMQASYARTSGEIEKKEVDVHYYTAWKDGLFAFREQRLEQVMETLARWYGFKYFFQNSEARDYVYTGKVSRHKELKEVLENFRLTEELDFKVNGEIVIIRTKN